MTHRRASGGVLRRVMLGAVVLVTSMTIDLPAAASHVLPRSAPAATRSAPGVQPVLRMSAVLAQEGEQPEPTEPSVPAEPEDTTPADDTTPPDSEGGTTIEVADPQFWQWILLGVLAIGALAVITRARRSGPDPRLISQNTQALLAHYQQVTTRLVAAPATKGEVAYQLGVLDTLGPRLQDLVASAADPERRQMLLELQSGVQDLEAALGAVDEQPESATEKHAITEAASVLEERLQRARAAL